MTQSGRSERSTVSPAIFADWVRNELALDRTDDGWVRGARALTEMYVDLDARRFETILVSLAAGRAGSAVAEGARWLLPRWQARP
jgi:hypothetical protein